MGPIAETGTNQEFHVAEREGNEILRIHKYSF